MPKEVGYGNSKELGQHYDGSGDPKGEYAFEDENMAAVKGTYPNPRPGASGSTGIPRTHPTFGG